MRASGSRAASSSASGKAEKGTQISHCIHLVGRYAEETTLLIVEDAQKCFSHFFEKQDIFQNPLLWLKIFAKVCTVNERHAGPVQTVLFGRFKEDDLL